MVTVNDVIKVILDKTELNECIDNAKLVLRNLNDREDLHKRDDLERFKSIKMALSRLPIEEHNGRYYLVLNPKHREQLRASFGNTTSDVPDEPIPCSKIDELTTLEVLDSQALEELILAEPIWTPDTESELLNSSEIVAAVLAGEPLQVLRADGRWISFKYASMTMADIAQTTRKIRRTRPTATICNVQINLGETAALVKGTTYYTPCMDSAQLFSAHEWQDSADDLLRLHRHIIHLKPVDAQRHAAVLIAQNNRSAMHLPSNQ